MLYHYIKLAVKGGNKMLDTISDQLMCFYNEAVTDICINESPGDYEVELQSVQTKLETIDVASLSVDDQEKWEDLYTSHQFICDLIEMETKINNVTEDNVVEDVLQQLYWQLEAFVDLTDFYERQMTTLNNLSKNKKIYSYT